MISLPLVWLISILATIAAFALVQDTRLPLPARLFLGILLVSLALIGLLLGLRLSFDVPWAAYIQPSVAVLIAPSAYLGFASLTQDGMANWRRTILINGVPLAMVQVAMLARVPISPDFLVLGVTSIFLFRIAALLRHAPDEFIHVTPQSHRLLRLAIYVTVILLAMMVATDLFIVGAVLFAGDTFVLTFLTGVSGVFTAFVFLVALIGVPMLLKATPQQASTSQRPTEAGQALLAELEALMNEKHLYTDSNLTLARVARRLSVSARDVSAAINGITGENFSRYINGFRIRHAQKALRETDLPITEVMFDAGFTSKSSFNTEFRRVTGQTPSQFRASKDGV